jgi:flagellar basal body rod protein FlgB
MEKLKKTVIIVSVFAFIAMPTTVFSQQANVVDAILFDDAEFSLESGIYDMSRRKAAVAYNIANGSTPGFRPIRFPDEIANARRLYGSTDLLNEISVDDEMVKATTIRLKHTAYVRLLSTKMGITKRIVTLGKGG